MDRTNDLNDAGMPADALDRALGRALGGPPLPADFRLRLRARLESSAQADVALRRRLLEQERRDQLAGLRADSIRMTWQTLGSLVGAAFVAGVSLALAWPWLRAFTGDIRESTIALCIAAISVVVAAIVWIRRFGAPRWLD
jgi:hypothetical protein